MKRTMSKWPGPGCLTLPRSKIANIPNPTATKPISRALVPKPPIVIASSHGIANTRSHRLANASFPKLESSPGLKAAYPGVAIRSEALSFQTPRYRCADENATEYLVPYCECWTLFARHADIGTLATVLRLTRENIGTFSHPHK